MLPDAARSSTSRPDTQETAAYAASQPLFDVLRGAISRLDQQKVYLTDAKETVQHIHVKVPSEHVENNGTIRSDYKDSLVAAWKSTTESYVRIFEQLCELTGPDPAAGKQADESYTGFQKLLYTAEAARTVAFEQDAECKRKRGEDDEDESCSSSEATPNKKVKHAHDNASPNKRNAVSDPSPSQNTDRPAKKQRTTTIEEADATPEKANDQPTINTVQRLKPKQIRKERKRRNQLNREQQNPAAEPAHINNVPQAQYEDVSAEVDARIRAKEEQKKAKKVAKKRKRDSQGSHILEAEPGAEREAMAARESALAQKPAKKKSRGESGEGVRVDGEKDQPAKGKRNYDEQGAEAAPEEATGARRSKRKKT